MSRGWSFILRWETNVFAQLHHTFADWLEVTEDAHGHPPKTDFQLGPSPRITHSGELVGQRHLAIGALIPAHFNHGATFIATYSSQQSKLAKSR